MSSVKISGFGQSATVPSSQEEGSQDKQVEQAKLVSSFKWTPFGSALAPVSPSDVTSCFRLSGESSSPTRL